MKKSLIILSILAISIPLFAFGRQVQLLQKNLFQSTNLVSYWRMEGNSTDSKGGNNGTDTMIIYGIPYGYFTQGANFNGSGSYINCGTASSLNITGNITISVWANATSFPPSGSSEYTLVEKGYDGTNEQYGFKFINPSGTPQLEFYTYSGTTGLHGTVWNQSLSTGTWYNLVGVFDGSNWKIYVNGNQVSTTSDSTAPISTALRVSIGSSDISGSAARFFPGSIDDVSIFSRSLTPAEIVNIFTSRSLGENGISR